MGFNVSSSTGALGRNRTCDLRFRKPLLYGQNINENGSFEATFLVRRTDDAHSM